MFTQPRLDHPSPFHVRTSPEPAELGCALERNVRIPGALLQLHFADQVASLPLPDVWSACCELLLQAQLVRESKLDRFVVDVEHIFDLAYSGSLLSCVFSREHVFVVDREEFSKSLEHVVAEIFEATTCPQLMHIAARWGASDIRSLPYSQRFSDSLLT
jgi:hypothetical protein